MLYFKTVEPRTFAILEKFSTQNLFITVPQAISYFTDADESEDPISLKGQTWEKIKTEIQKKISNYLR